MDSRLFDSINAAVKLAVKNDGDLTTKNLRYVYSVAMDISSKTGIDVDELFAEGVIAMKKCEQKYDPSKNNNFVKSCISSVRGYMMNYVNRMNNLVHIPVNHLKGFKSGQDERTDVSQISYSHIDGMDYDSLGTTDDTIFHRDKWGVVIEEGSYIEHPKKGRTSHITTLHSIPFGKKDREVRDFLKKGYMYVGKSETPHVA